jgi:uncharacterized membrane protein YoaT (DUF817 family)
MDASQLDFANRVARVNKRHRAMANGYSARLRGDGLIVVQPRQFRLRMPARGFVLLMICFMIFKSFLVSYLGQSEYESRRAALETGKFGAVGAWIMGVDPVTQVIGNLFDTLR